MILRSNFATLVEQGLIASVRVVPVPFEQTWCVDAVVRTPLEAGSTTDTIAAPDESGAPDKRLRKFDTIDEAAGFLRAVGLKTFTVDMDDAISFANVDGQDGGIVETTMRLIDDDVA